MKHLFSLLLALLIAGSAMAVHYSPVPIVIPFASGVDSTLVAAKAAFDGTSSLGAWGASTGNSISPTSRIFYASGASNQDTIGLKMLLTDTLFSYALDDTFQVDSICLPCVISGIVDPDGGQTSDSIIFMALTEAASGFIYTAAQYNKWHSDALRNNHSPHNGVTNKGGAVCSTSYAGANDGDTLEFWITAASVGDTLADSLMHLAGNNIFRIHLIPSSVYWGDSTTSNSDLVQEFYLDCSAGLRLYVTDYATYNKTIKLELNTATPAQPYVAAQDTLANDGTTTYRISIPYNMDLRGSQITALTKTLWGSPTISLGYWPWPDDTIKGYAYDADGAVSGSLTALGGINTANGSAYIPIPFRAAALGSNPDTTITPTATQQQWYSWMPDATLGSSIYLNPFDPPPCSMLEVQNIGHVAGSATLVTFIVTPRKRYP